MSRKSKDTFKLTVLENKTEIELTPKEFCLFDAIIAKPAISICFDKLIKANQILKNGVVHQFSSETLTEETLSILNSPKFNCQIPH